MGSSPALLGARALPPAAYLTLLLQIADKPCSRFALSAGEGARAPSNGGSRSSRDDFWGKAIDDTITAIEPKGGKIVMPKLDIPTVGTLIFFEDTEGTVVSAMQYDPEITKSKDASRLGGGFGGEWQIHRTREIDRLYYARS